MLTLYRTILYLSLPVVVTRLLIRVIHSKAYLRNLSQRFGYDLQLPGDAHGENADQSYHQGIWIHAVSVGEVNAAVPLVKSLLDSYPDKVITITTMTPTGSDRVKKVFGKNIQHCYLPYDYPGAVKRFMNAVRPSLAMVMETEIWPNFIHECHKRNIPMIYTNVRLSSRSQQGYQRFEKLFSPILKQVTQFAAQAPADADRLISIGANAEAVEVTGSIKFETTLSASVTEAAHSVRRDLGWERPVWVAGSTHEEEDSQVIDAYLMAKKEIKNLLLVLVPRHPERFTSVFRLCARYGVQTVLRSQTKAGVSEDTDIYLADTMGDLSLLIAASDIAFIGGSLVPAGGHNLLEACAAGIPVIFGPHTFNFQEISDLVLAKGAGVQVFDKDELSDVVIKLIRDPVIRDQYGTAGKELVDENKGALEKILKMVHQILRN